MKCLFCCKEIAVDELVYVEINKSSHWKCAEQRNKLFTEQPNDTAFWRHWTSSNDAQDLFDAAQRMNDMFIGYARVSTVDQELSSQTDILKNRGCEKIFHDHASGARINRHGLQQMLEHIRAGDTVCVVRLDRLGRSMSAVINIIQKIEDAGANFVSLTENIETTSPAGKMLLRMLAAFSEYERDMIRQRTKEGQSAAKERGVKFGRKPKIPPARKKLILEDIATGRYSAAEAARTNKINRSTISKWMKEL